MVRVSLLGLALLAPASAYLTGETIKIDGGARFQKGRIIRLGGHKNSKPFDAFPLKSGFSGTPLQKLMDD